MRCFASVRRSRCVERNVGVRVDFFGQVGGKSTLTSAAALQTPDNLAEPAHRIARDLAAQAPWAARLAHVTHPDRHEAAWYYALLKPLCARVDVWRTTYFHSLQGHDAIVEWFKGSALRHYLALLDGEEQPAFLDEYRRGIAAAYALHGDGTVLLPFPRLFVVATRGAQ